MKGDIPLLSKPSGGRWLLRNLRRSWLTSMTRSPAYPNAGRYVAAEHQHHMALTPVEKTPRVATQDNHFQHSDRFRPGVGYRSRLPGPTSAQR